MLEEFAEEKVNKLVVFFSEHDSQDVVVEV